jgi:dihydrodipicolinate synthase/N-acetylneuraminate lyase
MRIFCAAGNEIRQALSLFGPYRHGILGTIKACHTSVRTQKSLEVIVSKIDRVDWKGYFPAVTTPFNKERELDFRALGALLDWLHQEGMHGLFIGGTTGEWSSLSAPERKSLFTAAAGQMKGRLPILAGCTSYTPAETIELARHAGTAGFDGVVFSPPPYIRPNEEEIFNFYRTVAEAVRLPIVVYNWPAGTGIDMSVQLLARISALDKVVAIKQSTSHLDRFIQTLFELNGIVRVFGFAMDELGITLIQARGGYGTIGAGGVLGRFQPDFFNKLWAGDVAGARECGAKDCKILEAWYTPELIGRHGAAPAVMKTGLMLRGVPMLNHVRAPLMDVQAEHFPAIRRTLEDVGVSTRLN